MNHMARIPLIVTEVETVAVGGIHFSPEKNIMSAVKDNNFITIQGWMRTQLNLKGNELLIYALIYGFSQDGESRFKGSRKYIADWCGCSMNTVDRSLGSLVNKGLLAKYPHTDAYGNRLVDYVAIHSTSATTQSPAAAQSPAQDPWASTPNATPKQSQTPTVEPEREPQPLIDEPQAPAQPKKPDPTEEVISHLNQRAGTHYRATTATTRKLVKARLKEGFTVEDMKLVIDKKCADWLNNKDMAQYLRPETLFGSKFESYLNAQPRPRIRQNNTACPQNIDPAAAAYLEANAKYLTDDRGWF